jgi:hypothetical protein
MNLRKREKKRMDKDKYKERGREENRGSSSSE